MVNNYTNINKTYTHLTSLNTNKGGQLHMTLEIQVQSIEVKIGNGKIIIDIAIT